MIRPVGAPVGQRFGENPTKYLPPTDPIIRQFGNYQPDGHSGEDYRCGLGTPVRAVTSGTVLHIGWMGGTYAQNPWWIQPSFAGYCAVIDHGSFIGIYGHCQDGSAKVSKGDRVSEGQVFILSGNTGGSTGPHLHFEILPDGYVLNSTFYGRIDPEPLFTGSLSYASESITPLEDFMATLSEDEKKWMFSVLTALSDNAATKKDLAGIWKQPIDHRNPETGALEPAATTPETVLSYANWRLVTTLNTVAASARGIVDAVKASPGQDAAKAAEDAYNAFADKLKSIKLTVTAGGE